MRVREPRRIALRNRGTIVRSLPREPRVKSAPLPGYDWSHWRGTEVVCIASGPSLTAEDVEMVRQWRYDMAWRRVIVTNNTWQIAPWADALFAMDIGWWQAYCGAVEQGFKGLRLTQHSQGEKFGALNLRLRLAGFKNYKNSGACAVGAAIHAGACRVVMLGYDCAKTEGKAHWHPDHPKGLGNAGSFKRWPNDFELVRSLAARSKGLTVINASRNSVLRHFERQELEQALAWTAAT